MAKQDGRELARANDLRVLKALYKFGWLRSRDLSALLWTRSRAKRQEGLWFEPLAVEDSAWRMAQRTLSRLRDERKVIHTQAPDGSLIYGLAEAGARQLLALGIPAKSGKDQVRRVSLSYYHHRRLANEVAILASLQGYRVTSEAEIAAGLWFGGTQGIKGKRPDVVIRDGKNVWLVEIERSRRNKSDHAKILDLLVKLWPANNHELEVDNLPAGHRIRQVVFVCAGAFIDRLSTDMRERGWTDEQIKSRILAHRLLYVTEAKFVIRKAKPKDGPVAA